MRRGRVAVVVAAAAWFAPLVARAEAGGPPRVGQPGVYVVSSCGIVGHGATERAARDAFQRAVHEARRGWPTMRRKCALLELTDVVKLTPGQKPAFFVAGSLMIRGADPGEVVRRCRAEDEAHRKAEPNIDHRGATCDWVRRVYGPFARKPGWDELDDPGRYVFLDSEGNWVDEDGGPICFPAGTSVATPDGDRPIETLAAGATVLSWSFDGGGAPVEARVVDIKHRQAHELLELTLGGGRTLRVSANHPLYVPARGDWVRAGDLRAGDRLAVLTGGRLAPLAIVEIAARAGDVDVFDLTIETTHAYFAGGVLAHNY